MAPRRKRLEGDSGRCTKQQSKKVHAKKKKYYFHKKKVATVVADEKAARQVSAHRQDQLRRKEQGSARRPSFSDIWGENEKKEVNFILKAAPNV